MKFTPSGGKITLKAEGRPDIIYVSINDTGLGIAKEDIPKLFKQFSQVGLAEQKEIKASGTGLGLTICKTIVEAHGGRIWVESEKGKGSSFIFTLTPIQGAAQAPATPPTPPPATPPVQPPASPTPPTPPAV
jgi:signal transduction histidine kinase